MDSSVLKTLLETQNQAYRGALEVFMKDIGDKVNQSQTMIHDLKQSLEFTQKEVDDLKLQLNQVKQERNNDQAQIAKLTRDLQTSNNSLKELNERANYQEDYNRRNNLHFLVYMKILMKPGNSLLPRCAICWQARWS